MPEPASGLRWAHPSANGSFPPGRTFWLFLWQVLSADRSCREVVQAFLACCAVTGEEKEPSPNTAAYCKARQRLASRPIRAAHEALCQHIETPARTQRRWCGRNVKVVDGSGLSMPDTAANQERYPQSKTQKPGCGFPELGMVALFSLTTGAMLDYAFGNRHTHERTLFRSLWDTLARGDIVLADRGFCGFAEFYYLLQRGIDSVMRLHQRRTKGVRILKRLGAGDTLVQWTKSKVQPKWLTKEQWEALPDTLIVRHITLTPTCPGFRTKKITVATTLLDPNDYPPAAIAELYRRRWLCELYLRDIKISLGMDILRCKTPDMVEKEVAMHVIAYNLIRLILLDAATQAGIAPERISFKGTVQTLRQWLPRLDTLEPLEYLSLYPRMLRAIARAPVPNRPGRVEPRARKRRPKNYQLLTQQRHQFKESPHRNRYRKGTLS